MAKMSLNLHTTIEKRGPAAAVILTDEQVASLGAGKTPPVLLTIGGVTVATRIGRMGGENLLGLSKERREKLGVDAGDEVDVLVELDAEPREVEVPPELADALAAADLREAFDALSYTKRKEAARSVTEAKADATRDRRIAKVLDSLA